MILVQLVLAQASAEPCELESDNNPITLKCGSQKITIEASFLGRTRAQLDLTHNRKLTLDFQYTDYLGLNLNAFFVDGGTSHRDQLSMSDHKEIENIISQIKSLRLSDDNHHRLQMSLRFFEHLPVNTPLTPLQNWTNSHISFDLSRAKAFKFLCEYVGKEHLGHYEAFNQKFSVLVPIGDPNNLCHGRCGRNCDSNRRQYTQNCLDHDVCAHTLDDNFGPCSEEFWAAANDYMSAPECP